MRRVFVGLAITLAAFAPSWVRADDQKIAQEIVQELKANQSAGKLRGFKIDLQVDGGSVLLTGRVADYEQQQLAVNIARNVEGVRQVVNDLEVIRTSRPEEAKRADRAPRPFGIPHLPQLFSRASSEREEASRPVAKPVSNHARPANVQPAVPSHATLPPPVDVQPAPERAAAPAATAPQISDQQIATQIFQQLQQLKQSGHLRDFQLDMKVEEATVVLEGRVSAPEQKRLTLDVARRVPGVYQVVDKIAVFAPHGTAQILPASASEASNRRVPVTTPATPEPTPAVANVAQPTPAVASALQPTPAAPADLQPVPAVPMIAVPQAAYPQYAYYAQQPAGNGLPQAVPIPAHYGSMGGVAQVRYDHPQLPAYAWPSYAAYPNYAAVTYPKQYSPAAWPYIGPFYPYPQVPLGWRKVTLEWDDGWWQLDFKEK